MEQDSQEVMLWNSSGSPGLHPAAAVGTPGSLYWAPASSPSGQCYMHTYNEKGKKPSTFHTVWVLQTVAIHRDRAENLIFIFSTYFLFGNLIFQILRQWNHSALHQALHKAASLENLLSQLEKAAAGTAPSHLPECCRNALAQKTAPRFGFEKH